MLPLAALRDRRLTYRTLTVLGALCSFRQGSDDVSIIAGRDEIAERCRLHRSVISSATTELENLGWVEKVGRGGRSVKTTYRLTTPKTVADSATVTQPETVTDYVSKTVADSATRLYRTEVYTDICVNKPSADPDYFADFWKQYPKKVAKPQAMEAWRKIKPTGQLLSDLMIFGYQLFGIIGLPITIINATAQNPSVAINRMEIFGWLIVKLITAAIFGGLFFGMRSIIQRLHMKLRGTPHAALSGKWWAL